MIFIYVCYSYMKRGMCVVNLLFFVILLIVDIFLGFVVLVVDKEVIILFVFVDNVLNGFFVVVWICFGFDELDGDVFSEVFFGIRLLVEELFDEIGIKEEVVEVWDSVDEFDCGVVDDDFMLIEVDWEVVVVLDDI